MTETKKEPQILELRGHGEMQLSECLAILMLKVKQRSCNTLKTILHGKVIFTRNSCLDSQIEIPAFFFWLSALFFYFTYNASIYSSFVLNYLSSRMLAVFALCHSLGGALANFGATRGLGIFQPQGARPPVGFSYAHGT